MKNTQKGFVIPLLIILIAVLAIGGGVYFYNKNKPSTQLPVASTVISTTTINQSPTTTKPTATTKVSDNNTQDSGIFKGEIVNGYYVNAKAGFKVQIPQGWQVVDDNWALFPPNDKFQYKYTKAGGDVTFSDPLYSSDIKSNLNPTIIIKPSEAPIGTIAPNTQINSVQDGMKFLIAKNTYLNQQQADLQKDPGSVSGMIAQGYTPAQISPTAQYSLMNGADNYPDIQYLLTAANPTTHTSIFFIEDETYTGVYDIALMYPQDYLSNFGTTEKPGGTLSEEDKKFSSFTADKEIFLKTFRLIGN